MAMIACLRHQWRMSFSLLLLFSNFLHLSRAMVGSAARYSTPYIPTACYGSDVSEFPENGVFAAAGEGIWNNGAACGRQYLVSCLNGPVPSKCIPGTTIQVKIIDRAASTVSHPSAGGAALVLSTTAFDQLVNPPTTTYINIEYRQV